MILPTLTSTLSNIYWIVAKTCPLSLSNNIILLLGLIEITGPKRPVLPILLVFFYPVAAWFPGGVTIFHPYTGRL